MGLLAIVFAWRTYLFAYFYLSSLLFLLDIAFDTHAIREVYYLHKKNDRVKTLSLAMPQLVGVPGFEGRSPREDTAEKMNLYYPRNRINRESHAVKHCYTSRRLGFGVAERRVGTCSHLFVALTAQKNDRVKTLSLAMPQLVGVPGFEPGTLCSQSRCANRTALHPESFCECKGRQKNGFCKLFDKKKLKYCPIISSYGNKTRKSDELCEFCYTFVYIIYSKII